MKKFTADFETSTWLKDESFVWAWALCEIGNPDNLRIGNSIESFFATIRKENNPVILFHNLKFDGEFLLYHIIHDLGYTYKSHIASEDVKAAHYLFEYIKTHYSVTENDICEYQKSEKLLEHVDERLVTNINNLAGIIEGITADQTINEKEVRRLQQWLDENQVNKSYMLFNKIINEISLILEDVVTPLCNCQLLCLKIFCDIIPFVGI